ncbi:MAG: 4a-hydroxytetrahydrobiopterin dehydratase, partial [Gemmobacter sp.]|nr:4a-hydroxytetrahydrobiopterin dehydratase [Gemmobacter sp.]
MSDPDIRAELANLHADWVFKDTAIRRRFEFKTFARAMQMANLAGWLGEREGHHPDIAFGWGWCEIALT